MAAVQPINSLSIAVGSPTGTPTGPTFNFSTAALGGTKFLITGGTFTANGQKQFIDESYIAIWRNLAGIEAVASKLAGPVKLGWDMPLEGTQLLQAGTSYNLEAITNQTWTSLDFVFLEVLVYP